RAVARPHAAITDDVRMRALRVRQHRRIERNRVVRAENADLYVGPCQVDQGLVTRCLPDLPFRAASPDRLTDVVKRTASMLIEHLLHGWNDPGRVMPELGHVE